MDVTESTNPRPTDLTIQSLHGLLSESVPTIKSVETKKINIIVSRSQKDRKQQIATTHCERPCSRRQGMQPITDIVSRPKN